MKKEHNKHFIPNDEIQLFYNDDEDYYYNSTSFDDQIDFIVGTLQNNGCKQKVEEIEDFLYDYGDKTLYEWYRDLQDPEIANFTYNYIEELLNHKFSPQK